MNISAPNSGRRDWGRKGQRWFAPVVSFASAMTLHAVLLGLVLFHRVVTVPSELPDVAVQIVQSEPPPPEPPQPESNPTSSASLDAVEPSPPTPSTVASLPPAESHAEAAPVEAAPPGATPEPSAPGPAGPAMAEPAPVAPAPMAAKPEQLAKAGALRSPPPRPALQTAPKHASPPQPRPNAEPQLDAPALAQASATPATTARLPAALTAHAADGQAELEARIRAAVQAAVRYPATARMMGLSGRARLLLDYRAGAVGGVSLAQTAGAPALDDAALAAARTAHYPPAPPDVGDRPLRFLVWVEFNPG